MKGSKYLSEMVDVSMLLRNRLNIIQAPTGSGKTFFALTHVPSLTSDAIHNVVYLIDTINGKEQIVSNYNATSEYWGWAREIDEQGMWFSADSRVVVLTYAKFGYLSQQFTDFHANFDYIICDELHSLFHFQDYSPKPNLHSVALMGIRSAVKNTRTTVIALTATPSVVKKKLNAPFYELPIAQDVLIHYDQEQIIPFTNLEYVLSAMDTADIGLCYTSRISQMLEIERIAKEMGLRPVCVWSTANKDHPMTEEQLAVRESVLRDFAIPDAYNLLIINSSSETSLKIKSHVDYVIVNSTNSDTQVQVRGRVNSDLKCLYLLNDGTEPIILPDEFLGVPLFTEDKDRLCSIVNLKDPYNVPYKWPTVKSILLDCGYQITLGRKSNKRYAIITLPQD